MSNGKTELVLGPSTRPLRIKRRPAASEGPVTRAIFIGLAVGFLGLFLIAPLAAVFTEALAKGFGPYFSALGDRHVIQALNLTLLIAAISVPANLVFGIAAAWLIAKFDFKGKSLLVSLIDIPFSVSPVVSGLIFVLLFGANSFFGPMLTAQGFQVIFAVPGIVLATIFITFPFIARELIPLMEEQGTTEEQAALSLGASGWRTFFLVTLPNVKWGLLYGVLLCNARAMGEFGAVSVVSGHILGKTMTLPLQIELIYNEYNFIAAFAVASLLAMLALVTLALKTILEARFADELAAQRRSH